MSIVAEDIKDMTLPQKAELYYLLGKDEALTKYIFSNERLFAELEERDKAVANGTMGVITREELTLRLNMRRNGL